MFIELGILNLKLLIPLMYPLFYQIRRYIHKNSNPFYVLFTDFIGYLFGGIIFLIIKFRMRKINKKKENKEVEKEKEIITLNESIDNNNNLTIKNKSNLINQLEVEKKKLKRQNLKKKYFFLLILSFINLVPMPLEIITDEDININFKIGSSLFYHIFFFVVFSRIILGIKIYRHQLFSLLVIIICMPILLTFYLVNDSEDKKDLILESFYLIIIICLYSLYDILGKKYYNTYMDSPYHLMFIIGVISLSLIIPYEIITVLINGIGDNSYNGIIYQIKTYYKDYSYWFLLIFILDVLNKFLMFAGIMLTIYFFTPCHFIISESLSQIVSTIVDNSLEEYNKYLKIIIFILYFIIVFSSLIYNEIIIINVCSLSKNTKKKIVSRELIDKDMKLNLLENEMDERPTVSSNY